MNPLSVICPNMDIRQLNWHLARRYLELEGLKCQVSFDLEGFDDTPRVYHGHCTCSECTECDYCYDKYLESMDKVTQPAEVNNEPNTNK